MSETARRWKRWQLGLAGLIALIALGSYGYLRSGQATPPHIVITPASYDFGEILYTKVETEFQIRNTGGSPLEILSVSTSCGCTTAEVESKVLPPGSTTRLHVTFDPQLMGEEGEILRVVYVKSNDPSQPEIEIEIHGRVIKPRGEVP